MNISSSDGVTYMTNAGPPMQRNAPLQAVSTRAGVGGGRHTYAEMALMYVPIPGMMGGWMTLDRYEWVCYVVLGLTGF